MSIEMLLVVIVTFTTFFNNGVQAYIHFEAYPLLRFVGKNEFATYIKEYEGRLAIPLLLPYVVTLISNLALIFIRPAELSVIGVIVAFVLNASVSGVTIGLATPIYTRIVQAGEAAGEDMQRLMNINLLRLVISTIASAVVALLLLGLLGS